MAKAASKKTTATARDKAKKGSLHSMNENRRGEVKSHLRSAGTIKRLKMYRSSKEKRNKYGKVRRSA